MFWLVTVISSVLADYMLSFKFSKTVVRKIFNTLGKILRIKNINLIMS